MAESGSHSDDFLHLPGIEETSAASKESRNNLLKWMKSNYGDDKENNNNNNNSVMNSGSNNSISRMRIASSSHAHESSHVVRESLPPIRTLKTTESRNKVVTGKKKVS